VETAPDLQGIQGLKVLVVDDSVHALDAIDSMLRSLKIRPSFAKSGEEALQFLSKSNVRKEVPDLVIMDWLMPEMDGVETLKKINQDNRLSPKPTVVMMTAGSKEDLQTHIGEQPVSGVLSKPFTFSQLLDVILDARGQVQSEESSGTVEKNSDLQQIKGSKILVVDDNVISRNICKKILEEAGAEVEVAVNGEEALEFAFHNAFDLVIMDCQMPTMDGYEAARRIRRNAQLAQLPIIAMTASALMEDRVRTILAGMNEHISKPIDQPVFLDAVERWLRYSRQLRGNRSDPSAIGAAAEIYEVDGPEKILSEAGFDVSTAIARLAGDWIIYRNMLFGFAKNHANAPDEIRRALEMGEIPMAVRIAHSLKSVAAYLGIISLQSLAKTIEDHAGVIRKTDVYVLLDELRVVLDRSLDVVVAYQKELLGNIDSTDHVEVDVSQLESLLEYSDSSAVDLAHAFAKGADDSERGQLAKKVEDLASRYQYIEALEVLRVWKGK
jgi:CheY-like chemotaxis protein